MLAPFALTQTQVIWILVRVRLPMRGTLENLPGERARTHRPSRNQSSFISANIICILCCPSINPTRQELLACRGSANPWIRSLRRSYDFSILLQRKATNGGITAEATFRYCQMPECQLCPTVKQSVNNSALNSALTMEVR